MRSKFLILLWITAGAMFGCSIGEPRGILVTEVPVGDWSMVHPADVFYENTDTIGRKKLEVLVRFRNDFSCGQFDFILETLSPDNLLWRDTLTVPFRKEEMVEAVSLTYTDLKTPYRDRSRLLREGTYRFRFMPLDTGPCNKEIIGIGVEVGF